MINGVLYIRRNTKTGKEFLDGHLGNIPFKGNRGIRTTKDGKKLNVIWLSVDWKEGLAEDEKSKGKKQENSFPEPGKIM